MAEEPREETSGEKTSGAKASGEKQSAPLNLATAAILLARFAVGSPPMQERREHPRYRCKLRTGVLFPDGHSELLWAEDISRRGLSVHADKPQRIGVRLRVLVFMYSVRKNKEVHAEVLARVVSCVLDSVTSDFRLGLYVEEFVGEAESLFLSQIDSLSAPLQSENGEVRYGERPLLPPPSSFPLHRRIQLALAGGGDMAGWTEEVTPNSMRIALSRKLETKSVHGLKIPVVLAGDPEIHAVHASARVDSVIFRPMGAFATQFSVFDYQGAGLTLLRKELRQRFPEIAQESTALTDRPREPEPEDTEALPSLGDLGLYK
jgi:hypothetical protein